MFFKSKLHSLTACAGLLALVACGGGGGSGPAPDNGNGNGNGNGFQVPAPDAEAVFHLDYNELVQGQRVRDLANDTDYAVENQFMAPELVPGVDGSALRTDGFSTWISTNINLAIQRTMTVESWVALESYPSDHEVPHAHLSPSSFINQRSSATGFSVDINTFGQWEFRFFVSGNEYSLFVEEPFPLYEWTHIAAVIDTPNGNARLYLNGDQVANEAVPVDSTINLANVPLVIGKSNDDTYMGIFLVNALNGAFDETRIYPGARTSAMIQEEYSTRVSAASDPMTEALVVPESRFANDLQRPRLHAMPPANWANEPHGLIEVDGRYHMFYQRTPNGPFKTQMHWGHMVSDDLVSWEHDQDALRPTLEDSPTQGFDMKGIWSGDVVYDQGTAYAFYTNVNHSSSFNPGIAVAVSDDDDLRHWEKLGPIIDTSSVQDFRDPYLWKEGDTWHMLIGARISGGGALDYYRSTDLLNWTRRTGFTGSVAFSQLDIGSDIWEMPVFEQLDGDTYVLVVNPIGGQVSKYDQDKPTRGVYWTGRWDGNRFTPDYLTPKNLDVIEGHLSPTVTRRDDGLPVGIGIVDERRSSQAQLDAGWTHTFSFPRQWYLMDDRETLGQRPIAELEALRVADSHSQTAPGSVSGQQDPGIRGRMKEIIVEVDADSAQGQYGVIIASSADGAERTRLFYDADSQQVVLDKTRSSFSDQVEDKRFFRGDYDEAAFGKPERLHIFIDHSIVDVFINDSAAFSFRIYPEGEHSDHVYLLSQQGETTFLNVESWDLALPH
ncbi:GH32 C-terminal domain-containing protein [Marinimicrobium alkaliphilum]|uniref:GH32 C-terminal domain-containing protein n=1 Tax=Marinimicrobium alkaliphilum TaxID=2202654 RepID=UPI000DB9F39B|nr:GH32 C-terminal domain-containing protein [Marinimicrobium alkaliphilum]